MSEWYPIETAPERRKALVAWGDAVIVMGQRLTAALVQQEQERQWEMPPPRQPLTSTDEERLVRAISGDSMTTALLTALGELRDEMDAEALSHQQCGQHCTERDEVVYGWRDRIDALLVSDLSTLLRETEQKIARWQDLVHSLSAKEVELVEAVQHLSAELSHLKATWTPPTNSS